MRVLPISSGHAWSLLATELRAGLRQLDESFDFDERPRRPEAERYMDQWTMAEKVAILEEDSDIQYWSMTGAWREMPNPLKSYFLQWRLWLALDTVTRLYYGDGETASSVIPAPAIRATEQLKWWLMDWWDNVGRDLAFGILNREIWSAMDDPISPEHRRLQSEHYDKT